jgi:hypothetical protein
VPCIATSSLRHQRFAHTSDHLLHGAPKLRDPNRRAIGAVTVRASAVHDEHRLGRVLSQRPAADSSMRQIDRTGHVSKVVELWTAHVENNKSGIGVLQRGVHIPTISLEREQPREICVRLVTGRGRNLRYWRLGG